MATTTKKDLIDRVAAETDQTRADVKRTVQSFLDNVIRELSEGNRLEFRDFGVFEIRQRAARMAQNPKTLEQVPVPAKRTVKFKVGRLMKMALEGQIDFQEVDRTGGRPTPKGDDVAAPGISGAGVSGMIREVREIREVRDAPEVDDAETGGFDRID